MDESVNQLAQIKMTRDIQFDNLASENFVCRICLEQMKQSQLVDYCLCKGSSSQVHQSCLLKWAQKAYLKASFLNYFIYCDICKSKIQLDTQFKINCPNKEQIRNQIFGKDICCTVFTFVVILGAFATLLFIIYAFSISVNQFEKVIIVIGLIITCLVLIIAICVYLFYFLLKFEVKMCGISKRSKKIKLKLSNGRIHPTQQEQNEKSLGKKLSNRKKKISSPQLPAASN